MNPNPHANGQVLHAGAPLDTAALAVVLLHGRGASAADILALVGDFHVPGVAYLAPQALNRTWYPLSFLAPREANEPFLSSALATVDSVVRHIEDRGLARDRIVIAGFSQGACLATEYVAGHPARYGGLIALTGGLIGPPGSIEPLPDGVSAAPLAGTPAFLGSGDPDPHVPWARVQESADRLRALGAEVTLRRYPGRPHTVSADEIAIARTLLGTAAASG